VVVVTTDGRTSNGLIRKQISFGLLPATGPNQEVRLSRSVIKDIHPGGVSVMSAGLDKQLTNQVLADLGGVPE
jgi:hypothetical protein